MFITWNGFVDLEFVCGEDKFEFAFKLNSLKFNE